MPNPKALRGYYLKCSVVFFLMCRSVSVGLSWSTAWFPGHVHQLQGCACWGTCTMAPMGSSLMGRLTWAKIQTLPNFSHQASPYFHFSVEKAVCISRSWIGFWLHERLSCTVEMDCFVWTQGPARLPSACRRTHLLCWRAAWGIRHR